MKQFPTAQYVAEKFTDRGKGQAATGQLTIRNVTKEVSIVSPSNKKTAALG